MGVAQLATALALVAGAAALGQEPPVLPPPSQPAARLVPLPVSPTDVQSSPLLQVPASPLETRPPCRPCPNEYHPSHVYLPEQSPDCSGGCDGDCHACRRGWFNAAFFIGKSQNLDNVERRYIYGLQAGGGYWFDDERSVGIDLGYFVRTRFLS